MIRAIRIRLYPTPDQKKYLAGLFGAVRFCYNKALYLKTHFYKVKGVNLRKLFKNPRAKPDGTKMFCSAFLNDARMCCFFANAIVKY